MTKSEDWRKLADRLNGEYEQTTANVDSDPHTSGAYLCATVDSRKQIRELVETLEQELARQDQIEEDCAKWHERAVKAEQEVKTLREALRTVISINRNNGRKGAWLDEAEAVLGKGSE